jgi:hypothetical protein
VHIGLGKNNLRKEEHLEDLGVDGRIVLNLIFPEVCWRGKDWIDQAQNMYRWRAVVNAVMNFRVP